MRGAVRQIAQDLVKLYAEREEQNGYMYGPDTVWQREFEELFPFEETEDQVLAIDATKRDMESTWVLTRLQIPADEAHFYSNLRDKYLCFCLFCYSKNKNPHIHICQFLCHSCGVSF